MALQYPLLFPYGETGYHENIPYHCNRGKRKTARGYITMREFYCYRIQQRENEGTTLLRGGWLFQQYLVDAYTAVEEQRLKYLRNHQNELRTDLYNNVCDAVTRGDTKAASIGKRIILPSLHTCSPRYMLQNYQDAMALCREFDKPDLFITFTSNPKWPEIEGIYIIEFQKRGLPHVYLLIWLTRAYKCKTLEDIDDLISAEIPNEEHDPEGSKAITEFMLHGPCGRKHKDSPCMIDNQCSKHFPKPYYAETTIDEDGYANYSRRNNGVNVNKGPDRATIVIQENILPTHNKSDIPEKIIDIDEIKNYLDYRYLSPCETVWRLFSYYIHFSKTSIIKLSYHLPNQQSLTLHDSQHLPALLQRSSIKETMFTQWFELNKQDPKARSLTYTKIPKEYVWNNDAKEWAPRKLRPSIGRIVYSNPASGERYYLRMLLNIVKGPRSFEELRTVDGTLHHTFKDACFAYGLLHDDREWTEAISEAKLWASGAQIRDLFVTMLLFCNITNPLTLWEQHWEDLADDILHKKRKIFNFPDLNLTDSHIKNYCLVEIQGVLHKHGKSLSDFPALPQPNPSLLTQLDNRLIRRELNYNIKEMKTFHDNLFRSLNPEQLALYELLIKAVTNQEGGLYFLYGPGGTGKTFLYNTILTKLRSEKMIVLAVASSVIASLLLPGGRTAHSRFVIPLELMENSTCGIRQKTHLAALMHEARLIIWDEAPMTQRYAFEVLNKTLRDILGSKNEANRDKLFGGMPILLGGDFRQILPVIPKGKRQEVVHACINRSELWKFRHLHTLSRIMRVNEYTFDGQIDSRKCTFNKWVLDVGNGNMTASSKDGEDEPSWIKIPNEFIVKYGINPIETIVDTIFPDFNLRQDDEDYLRERAILTPRNNDVDAINKHMFKKLQGETMTFKSPDEICKGSTDSIEQQQSYPVEYLNKLDFSGVPPHKLKLKIGQPIMLLRNLHPSGGLCNGTRMIITSFQKFVLQTHIITISHIGTTVIIHRIVLTFAQSKWPFVMQRIQFPVRPCYAMTINKSQAQSLNLVDLYLPKPVFSHGQLYVAFSRVTTPDGLKIVMVDESHERLKGHTRNVVYKETFFNLNQTL
ncbi:ATP-dependent DNA helicase RRM3-like [Rutidosis leptorrhynchoides]|uniref:ATP-dependent DNA helicase RRM3-like n=1 Tax=Rutidosis leptorrhynchoides TaxID=125765 RepID=UPI003A9A2939